jgi:hypothetical protein
MALMVVGVLMARLSRGWNVTSKISKCHATEECPHPPPHRSPPPQAGTMRVA